MLNFPSFFNAQVGGYEIEQSLRFNDDDSAYLQLNGGTSPTDGKIFTHSVWVKRSEISGNDNNVFGCAPAGTVYNDIKFDSNDQLYYRQIHSSGGVAQWTLKTSARYRDPSAWLHIVVAVDTTQATSSDRVKMYVNGAQITQFDSESYPGQNQTPLGAQGAYAVGIGRLTTTFTHYFDGYMAEYHYVDGTAHDPTDFGEYDANGVWRPIKVTGITYGNLGWYLPFDPTATNGIGHDHSGNGNHWTANGFFNEIGTPDYSNNWIGSTSGSFYSGSWENVFNGDVTVYSNYIYAYNNTATLTFSTPLTGVIEVYGSDGGNTGANSGYISLSDGSTWSINNVARANAQWHSFGSKSNITTITVSSPGGHGAMLGAIRVDGNLLANISAKANYANMADTPTTNWATLNPNDFFQQTISNGNLVSSNTNNVANAGVRATMAMPSGKWYWEITCGVFTSASTWMIGVADTYQTISLANYTSAGSYLYYSDTGNKYNASSSSAYGATYTTGDVIGVAYDADNGKIWFAKNNTWQNSGDPAAGTGEAYSGITGLKSPYVGTGYYQVESFWNFGQRAFEYTPPTGFKPLNTSNLSAPTVKDGSQYFDTLTWTGDSSGASRTLSGLAFGPDLVWAKGRNQAISHQLTDIVRGAGATSLRSDDTRVEGADGTSSGYLSAFTSDGFETTSSSTNVYYNTNTYTYAAWCWDAGGSGSSNTAGSITSTVSANPSAGFSIVSYTGTQQADTIGHGLGVAPSMIICKDRDVADRWPVYHSALGNAKNLRLDNTTAQESDSGIWNSTSPTSTVFSVGTSVRSNRANSNYIAYCFAEVEGYSKFGSYVGNGSTTDGPFIWCGFTPRWILFKWYKDVNSAESWHIYDTARQTYNANNTILQPDSAGIEETPADRYIDILSNGFKLRQNGQQINRSGASYIFMALAENPFGGDGVSPATAR